MIGDLCDGINAFLASNDKLDNALGGNDVCLEVDASLASVNLKLFFNSVGCLGINFGRHAVVHLLHYNFSGILCD